VTPAVFGKDILSGSPFVRNVVSNPSPALNGRAVAITTGNALGGGSAINFMLYARAQARDFDDWNVPGWSSQDLVPLLQEVVYRKICLRAYNGNLTRSMADGNI
jgi:alcohol oxidase